MEPEILLMNKVKKGDLEAFDSIVDKYKRRIYNHILLMSRDSPEAEELSQKVFLEVFEKSQSYQPVGKFSTYIFSIAHRLCEGLLEPEVPEKVTESQESEGDRTSSVRAELLKLKRRYREFLILREIQRFNYEEIREIMGCPIEEVRKALNRARRIFTRRISRFAEEN